VVELKPHGWRKRVDFAWVLAWLTLDARTLSFGGFTLEY
jgi:hypothetical protein